MKVELPIDYATLKKQLQEMTTEMEFWRSEAVRLEKELDRVDRELRFSKPFNPDYIDY